MDCDSPLLPWDPLDFPEKIISENSFEVEISLATALENALDKNICGQLEV